VRGVAGGPDEGAHDAANDAARGRRPVAAVERRRFELPAAGGLVVRGEALLPAGARTGVVVCHGFKGFSRWAFFPHVAERVAEAGLSAVTFNFSGSGVGPDGENFTETDAFETNTFTRELDDLTAVEREATQRGWLGEQYGVFGHSRGGGLAVLHAARDPRVAALATWAPISTVERWPAEVVARWRERGYNEVVNSRTGQTFRLRTAVLDDVERARGAPGSPLDIPAAAAALGARWADDARHAERVGSAARG
jgi:uncharacterized protein